MNALVRKEIRLILPAWTATMILAIVPWWFLPRNPLWTDNVDAGTPAFFLFFFSVLYLAVTSFGQEFSLNTFPLLLAQPVPRRRLWTTKLVVLAIAFALVLLGLWGSWMLYVRGTPAEKDLPKIMLFSGMVVLVLVAGGLWTTLQTRQVAVAFWLTLLFPLVLTGLIVLVLSNLHLRNYPPAWYPPALPVIAAAIYSFAGFFWAHRLFHRAEDVPWSGGSISIPTWRSGARAHAETPTAKGNSFFALIRKELHFHQISLMIGGLLVLIHIPIIGIRIARPDLTESSNILAVLLVCWVLLWLLLPFLIGSMAVAEERRLGTLESFLCLPVTRRAQFGIKLGVVIVLSVLLCVMIPWVLESLGSIFGLKKGIFIEGFDLGSMVTASLLFAALAFVSFYSSTLARNTLQAVGAAFVLSFPVMFLAIWAASSHFGGGYGANGTGSKSPLDAYVSFPTMFLVLLWLAGKNFKHVQVGWHLWIRNGLTLLISLGTAFVMTGLIYDRAWEHFMTLEPPHGQAQLSGPVRPRINLMWGGVFVLLPDGRLWAGRHYEFKKSGEYAETQDVENKLVYRYEVSTLVPVDGMFIGASNWTSVANSGAQVFGVQSDGSLWKIFSRDLHHAWTNLSVNPQLERVGTDSNWKTLAAGYNHFLALKSDGTLWGWGINQEGQLGPLPKGPVDQPTRISPDSDWTAIFAANSTSTAIKRNGSAWKWGYLTSRPTDPQPQSGPHPEPLRWDSDGTDWIALAGQPVSAVVVRQDGSLWASGNVVFGNVFGHRLDPRSESKLLRAGSDSDWADVCGGYNDLLGLKKDGTFLQNDMTMPFSWRRSVLKPSRHSDWLAIGTDSDHGVTLAADGTLSCWRDPHAASGLLSPSRRPLWSANIFSITKEPAR